MPGTDAVKYGKGPQRLGEAGLALHYANMINQIYMIVSFCPSNQMCFT
jgi:hypothetical protein